MKKFILFFILLFVSCSNSNESQKQEDSSFSPNIRHTTMQYGYPNIIKENNGPLFAYIRFPFDFNFSDIYISDWVHEIYQNAQNTVDDLRKKDETATGEINIQFDSYLVENRFAGVVLQGMFMHSALANPIEIIKTFNIDIANELILENTDILDFLYIYDILSLLRAKIIEARPDIEDILVNMNEKWLANIAIGSEGIYIILPRGDILPSYIGTLKILIPYNELEFALLLNKEAKIETTPEIEQTQPPETTPEQTQPPEEPTETTPEPTQKPVIPSVPPQSGNIDPTKPMVALTFDDGPGRYTLRILELLNQYGVNATFFVVGNIVDAKRDIVSQVSASGNDILGHSWDHSDLTKLTPDEVRAQLLDTAMIIELVTGIRPHSFRPPYGAFNDNLRDISSELGFGIINWSVDTLDWQSRDADAVFNAVINDVSNRAIILNHDLYESTADAMERIIPELILRGYQLVTISELIQHSNTPFEAGRVIYNGN